MPFGFKLGKSKDKKKEKDAVTEESNAGATAPEELTADVPRPQPHGPLQELEVDSKEDLEELGFDESLDIAQPSGEEEPSVKVVELQTEGDELEGGEDAGLETDAVASDEAKPEEKKGEKPSGGDDSFSSLFVDDEEEENPLAALIASLPDVSAQEIISDISELTDIMREGH